MKAQTTIVWLVCWALLPRCHGRRLLLNTNCDVSDAALQDDLDDQAASATKVCFPVRGTERCFFLLLPECARDEADVSLVVDLHDTASCPLTQSRVSGWKEFALSECFAVAWPLGVTDPNVADAPCFTVPGGLEIVSGDTVGVAPDCCCKKGGKLIPETETNDVEFIHDVINKAIDEAWYKDIEINATKVQLSGYGTGATAAMGFAAIHSDIVSCLSPFAGPMVTAITEDYNPVPVFSVLDSGRIHQDKELSYDDILLPGNASYILPSPSRVDEVFSAANKCGRESTARSNTATNSLTKVEGVVTGGKFSKCVAPVNFLKPPFAAYKYRSSSAAWDDRGGEEEDEADSATAVNRVVDTTALAYMFCKDRTSKYTDYVRVERPINSAATSTHLGVALVASAAAGAATSLAVAILSAA